MRASIGGTEYRGQGSWLLRAGMATLAAMACTAASAEAATTVTLSNGVLKIQSGPDDESFTIDQSGDFFEIEGVGFTSAPPPCEFVNANLIRCPRSAAPGGLVLNSGDGEDAVIDETSAPTTAKLGGGKDYAKLGSGADKGVGGAGNDAMIGDAGADGFVGGPGTDACVGGKGADTTKSCEKPKFQRPTMHGFVGNNHEVELRGTYETAFWDEVEIVAPAGKQIVSFSFHARRCFVVDDQGRQHEPNSQGEIVLPPGRYIKKVICKLKDTGEFFGTLQFAEVGNPTPIDPSDLQFSVDYSFNTPITDHHLVVLSED